MWQRFDELERRGPAYRDGETLNFGQPNKNPGIVVIACLAFVLLFTCFWTTRIVKEVDLVGALRFLWLLLWILPVAAFLNITAFDYYDVTSAWIRHNWNSIQLWWFRTQFCLPDTADSLCIVPIDGGQEYDSEDDWCFEEHNSTGCTDIRDQAQEKTAFFSICFLQVISFMGMRIYVHYSTNDQDPRTHHFKTNGAKVKRSECRWLAHFSSILHSPVWFDYSLLSLHLSRQIDPTTLGRIFVFDNLWPLFYSALNGVGSLCILHSEQR